MKEIKLTQGKVAIVDDEDFERLNQNKWCAHWDGYNWYAIRRRSCVEGKQIILFMHRVIMNTPPLVHTDHRDGEGLNNCKENLRICTHQENQHNRKLPHKTNKLGVKGVIWDKKQKKFRTQIGFNGKTIHLGYFTVLADAVQDYRVAEIKYFGEFAREETKKLYQIV